MICMFSQTEALPRLCQVWPRFGESGLRNWECVFPTQIFGVVPLGSLSMLRGLKQQGTNLFFQLGFKLFYHAEIFPQNLPERIFNLFDHVRNTWSLSLRIIKSPSRSTVASMARDCCSLRHKQYKSPVWLLWHSTVKWPSILFSSSSRSKGWQMRILSSARPTWEGVRTKSHKKRLWADYEMANWR